MENLHGSSVTTHPDFRRGLDFSAAHGGVHPGGGLRLYRLSSASDPSSAEHLVDDCRYELPRPVDHLAWVDYFLDRRLRQSAAVYTTRPSTSRLRDLKEWMGRLSFGGFASQTSLMSLPLNASVLVPCFAVKRAGRLRVRIHPPVDFPGTTLPPADGDDVGAINSDDRDSSDADNGDDEDDGVDSDDSEYQGHLDAVFADSNDKEDSDEDEDEDDEE